MEQENSIVSAYAPTRRQWLGGAAVAMGGLYLGLIGAPPAAGEEISRTAEAIHQEPVFKAARKHIYEALTDAKQFQGVVQLSEAMKGGMPPGAKPAEISREAGGAFLLFAGYISGRQIEIVPGERIVQAWRVASWEPGVFSIAKFVLVDQGSGAKIIFDHTGFPNGQAEHLAGGWKANYWEPLEKYLAQQ